VCNKQFKTQGAQVADDINARRWFTLQ